jgi:type II secretory pathway predicted ATPase ExeA
MKAKLSPVEPELEPGFLAFKERHDLSFRLLAKVLGGAATHTSSSSIERICKGTAQHRYFNKYIQAEMRDHITAFLTERKFSSSQINAEISAIFQEEETEMLTTLRTELEPSVQRFFGLKRDPFSLFPRASEEAFTTKELEKTLEKIKEAVNFQGFIAIVGEIGTGKSVLKVRLEELAEASEDSNDGEMKLIWPAFFEMSEVNSGAIVIEVLRAFDQPIPQHKVDRKKALVNTLKNANANNVKVAIVIDEAHRLNDKALSSLKNFYEILGAKWRKYIGIVLFGQPLLQGRLREVRFQEIAERLTVVKMPALGKKAEEYLDFRISLAGGKLHNLFDEETVKALIERAASKRNPATPLQLGNLCNQALIAAEEEGEKRATATLLRVKMPGLFVNDEPKVRNMSGGTK